MLREVVKSLNKSTLSEATGISYGRLRKFASGVVKILTDEEKDKIYFYLLSMANKIKEN